MAGQGLEFLFLAEALEPGVELLLQVAQPDAPVPQREVGAGLGAHDDDDGRQRHPEVWQGEEEEEGAEPIEDLGSLEAGYSGFDDSVESSPAEDEEEDEE